MSELITLRNLAKTLGINPSGKQLPELKKLIAEAQKGDAKKTATKKASAPVHLSLEELTKRLLRVEKDLGITDPEGDDALNEETEAEIEAAAEEEEEEEKPAKKTSKKPAAKEEEEEEEEEESSDEDEELEIKPAELKKAKLPQLVEWATTLNKLAGKKALNVKEKDADTLREAIKTLLEENDSSEEEEEEEEEEKPAKKTAAKGKKDEPEEEEEDEFEPEKGDRVIVMEGTDDEFIGVITAINLKKKQCDVKNEDDGEEYEEIEFSDLKAAPKKAKKKLA